MSPHDALVTALEVWDKRCSLAPEGQPTRRVPNHVETAALELELRLTAGREGVSTFVLRREVTRARFEGLPPHEAVPTAVQRAREST